MEIWCNRGEEWLHACSHIHVYVLLFFATLTGMLLSNFNSIFSFINRKIKWNSAHLLAIFLHKCYCVLMHRHLFENRGLYCLALLTFICPNFFSFPAEDVCSEWICNRLPVSSLAGPAWWIFQIKVWQPGTAWDSLLCVFSRRACCPVLSKRIRWAVCPTLPLLTDSGPAEQSLTAQGESY